MCNKKRLDHIILVALELDGFGSHVGLDPWGLMRYKRGSASYARDFDYRYWS